MLSELEEKEVYMKKNRRMLKIFCDILFWFSVLVSILLFVIYLFLGFGSLFSGFGRGFIGVLVASLMFILTIAVLCVIRYFILCVIDISKTNEMIANNVCGTTNTVVSEEEEKKEDDDTKLDADDKQIDEKVKNAFKQYEENAKKDIESDE